MQTAFLVAAHTFIMSETAAVANNRIFMKLLHTSDWHIGRQLHGVSLLPDQAYVLDQIVDIAEQENVDAVIIAGDVYDRAVPPADAVRLLSQTLNRLCHDLSIPVIIIAGNHDSGERLGFAADLLNNAGLHIAGSLQNEIAKVTLQKGDEELDIFGLPYAGPLAVRQLTDEPVSSHEQAMAALLQRVSKAQTESRPTVVVAHCFVDGASECESERPLSIGGADRVSASLFKPFNYAALGHLHGRQFQGDEHIRYSGSILKYSFSEVNHHKSVTLVEIDRSGKATTEYVELKCLRNLRIVEGSLEEILQQGKEDPNNDDYILARVSNTESILDVMAKLRSVYPNVLQMQNTAKRKQLGGAIQDGREILKKNHLSLFAEFFEHTHGESLTPAQHDYMVDLLERLESEVPQ